MSTFKAFERSKLSRFINTYGNTFIFRRKALNDYKEPKKEGAIIASIKGVFHEGSGGYISSAYKDGSKYIRNLTPMILCLQDKGSAAIKPDDYVEIFDKSYKVTKLYNVGNFGYAWDISLELIDDGGNV